jgi:ribosomal protein S18 acetylase RimI-like enzyme
MADWHIAPFESTHLRGVLRLCEAEGWPSLPSDPARAAQTLTAPGAVTVVALRNGDVVGFAFALVDAGRIDAYLSTMAVDSTHRRQGIATALIREVFASSGASRLDLLAEPGTEAFYESLPHRDFKAFRVYPDSR